MSQSAWGKLYIFKSCPHKCEHSQRSDPKDYPHLRMLPQMPSSGGRIRDHVKATTQHVDCSCGYSEASEMREATPYEEIRSWVIWGKVLELYRQDQCQSMKLNQKEKRWLKKLKNEGLPNAQWNEILTNAPYLPDPLISPWSHGGIGPSYDDCQYPDIPLHPSVITSCIPFNAIAAAQGLPALSNGQRQDQPRFLSKF